jgi:hypothetical protein
MKLDILQPISNTSKSAGVILTKFLKPAPSSTVKSANKLPPHFVASVRKSLVHQRLRFIRRQLSFNNNTDYSKRKLQPHDIMF